MQDLHLITNGTLQKRNLYAIRKGELVNDTINEGLRLAPGELIKVREKAGEGAGCIYYDEAGRACTIYEQRPAQCSALKCWDTTEILRVYSGPKPGRNDIIKDSILLGVIEEHEKRCSYSTLEGYVRQIEVDGEKAVEKILEVLRFDHHLRPFMSEKLGLDPEETDLFFGRSLIETITMFGLKVTRESDGAFSLTTIKSS
jgi:Fe-S-cluster containining protein